MKLATDALTATSAMMFQMVMVLPVSIMTAISTGMIGASTNGVRCARIRSVASSAA